MECVVTLVSQLVLTRVERVLYTGFFFARWKFSRISRFIEKSRKDPAAKKLLPRKNISAKKTEQDNFKKKMFKKGFLSLISLFVFRAMVKAACNTNLPQNTIFSDLLCTF